MTSFRAILVACVCVLLNACGGGGGGPGPGTANGGSFTLSTTSASFRILANPGQAYPDQTIRMTVTNTTNVAGVGAAFPASQGTPSWLTVIITGTLPNFDVRLSVSSFTPPGHYTATLILGTGNANGTVLSSQEVPVSLHVAAPVSVADISPVTQPFVFGAANDRATFTRNVQAQGGTWTVSSDVPWISVPGGTQSGSAALSPTIDASNLAIGTHTGRITIQNAEFTQSASTVDVTAVVQPPTVTLSRTSVLLGGVDGTDMTAQELRATLNTGNTSYPWTLALSDTNQRGWLSSNATSGVIGGVQEAAVQLRFEPSAVGPGTHSGTARFDVTVKGALFSASVPVTLNFESHRLVPQSAGVALSSFPSRQRLQRSITVGSSLGRANVPWTASSNQPWLTVTSSGQTGGTMTLTANTAGITPDQFHVALVTIASTDQTIERDEVVRVGLWASNTDPSDVLVQIAEDTVYGLAANPVEPLAYSTGFGANIYVHNVYTGALVNTLTPAGLTHAIDAAVSPDGRLLFVTDANTGNTLVLDGSGSSSAIVATYPPPFTPAGSARYRLIATRANGHSILWTPHSAVYDMDSHARVELRTSGVAFTASYSGIPAVTYDGKQIVELSDGFPHQLSVRTQRLSMLNGKALHLSGSYTTPFDPNFQSLGVGVAIEASGQRAFTDFSVTAAKVVQIQPEALVNLPDIPLPNAYPEAVASTWDGRVFFGLAFYAGEATDNLLAFDAEGNSLGSSMSGSNIGGRRRGKLAFSGDLFRVVSAHVVPNGMNPPVAFAISFYDLP